MRGNPMIDIGWQYGNLADDNRGQLLRIAPTTPHLKYLHLTDSDPTLGDLHVLCNSVTPVRGSV